MNNNTFNSNNKIKSDNDINYVLVVIMNNNTVNLNNKINVAYVINCILG
jgi:hypothetical protein